MKANLPKLERWKPSVPKTGLLLLSGVTWIGVGIMLDGWSYAWLKNLNPPTSLLLAGSGFLLALIIHHFGFLRIVDKNLGRIMPKEGRHCLFSFFPWQSYVLMGIMIGIGYILRHSSFPKEYLAIIYSGIGTALILSSIRYLRTLMRLLIMKERL